MFTITMPNFYDHHSELQNLWNRRLVDFEALQSTTNMYVQVVAWSFILAVFFSTACQRFNHQAIDFLFYRGLRGNSVDDGWVAATCLTTGAYEKFTSAVAHEDWMDFDRPSVERDAVEDAVVHEFRIMFSYLTRLYGKRWMATPLRRGAFPLNVKLFDNLLDRHLPRTFMYRICREFMEAGAVYHSE